MDMGMGKGMDMDIRPGKVEGEGRQRVFWEGILSIHVTRSSLARWIYTFFHPSHISFPCRLIPHFHHSFRHLKSLLCQTSD